MAMGEKKATEFAQKCANGPAKAIGFMKVALTEGLELPIYEAFAYERHLQNQLFDPTGRAILAHPSIITDAQPRPDGTPDARTSKVAALDEPRTVHDGRCRAVAPGHRAAELVVHTGVGELDPGAAPIDRHRGQHRPTARAG